MARKSARNPSPFPSPSSASEDLTSTAPPTSIDPYKVLSIPQTATPQEITKAYRLAALRSHPDKAPSPDLKEEYTQKFQEIAFAYAILSDPARRKRYDATGNTSESLDLDDDIFDWSGYFREKYNEVLSADSIEKFKSEYQGSEEEKDDILNVYTDSHGDMDAIFETVMCSSILDDEDRFRSIIDTAIKNGDVKSYKKYTSENKSQKERRKRKAEGEAKEAEELAEELGVKDKLFAGKNGGKKSKKGGQDGESALAALIQQRQKGRQEDFFSRLEEKYGGSSGGGGGGGKKQKKAVMNKKRQSPSDEDEKDDDGPSEEAFKAMQERADRSRASKKTKTKAR